MPSKVKSLHEEIVRQPEAAGTPIERPDMTRKDAGEAPVHPDISGAPKPAPDTSRSTAGNRNPAGPREAGKTPRPTEKPGEGEMGTLRSALAELLPSWLQPKRPTTTPSSKSVPQGGSHPAGGGGNTSGSNGP